MSRPGPLFFSSATQSLVREMGYALSDFDGYYEDEVLRFLAAEKEARQRRADRSTLLRMIEEKGHRPSDFDGYTDDEILAFLGGEEQRRGGRASGPSVREAAIGSLDWISVSSTNVDAYAYAADFRRLYVSFLNGSVYSYEDVGPDVWEAFQAADSKGRFVWDVLRGAHGERPVPMDRIDNEYVYTRLR